MAIYLIDEACLLIGPVDCPVVPGMGIQLPSNATRLEEPLPPPRDGYVWAWRDNKAQELPDRRGSVYHIQTGALCEWRLPGDIPEIYTTSPRPSPFHFWKDGQWVLDGPLEAQALADRALAERDELLAIAAIRIAPLQDAVDLGKATPDEQAALLDWKSYRVDLNRISDHPTFPRAISWPTQPEDTTERFLARR